MKILGICGSSGSGKGYVCKILERHGVMWIDTDGVYRELTKTSTPCTKELRLAFGNEILQSDGSLNRVVLAKLVFEHEQADVNRQRLNEIAHKHIRIETQRLIDYYESQGASAVSVDAPVLFESGFDKMCHATICVTAPFEEKLERIIKRDSITKEQAIARLNKQIDDDKLRELCDYEIKNTNGLDVEKQIVEILKSLCIN